MLLSLSIKQTQDQKRMNQNDYIFSSVSPFVKDAVVFIPMLIYLLVVSDVWNERWKDYVRKPPGATVCT